MREGYCIQLVCVCVCLFAEPLNPITSNTKPLYGVNLIHLVNNQANYILVALLVLYIYYICGVSVNRFNCTVKPPILDLLRLRYSSRVVAS